MKWSPQPAQGKQQRKAAARKDEKSSFFAAAGCSSAQLSCAWHPQIILTVWETIMQLVANAASQFTFSLLVHTCWSSLFMVTGQVEPQNQMSVGEGMRSMSLHIFFPHGSVSRGNSLCQLCRQLCWCDTRCRNKQPWWLNWQNGQNTMTELQV